LIVLAVDNTYLHFFVFTVCAVNSFVCTCMHGAVLQTCIRLSGSRVRIQVYYVSGSPSTETQTY